MKKDQILIKPVVTEKATNLIKENVYTFEVHPHSTKNQIREVLTNLYKVKIARVQIMIRKGKTKRVGKRMVGKTLADRKFAYVKLLEGKIDLFPQT